MSATAIEPHRGSYLMPSLEHATVSDAMHPGVYSCEADAPVTEVARLMATHHLHSVAVLGVSRDERGERFSWGVVSDVDVLRAGIAAGGERRASEVAQDPLTVEPLMPMRDAVRLMLDRGVSHAIVVDPNRQRPIGILSTLDAIGVLAWGEG